MRRRTGVELTEEQVSAARARGCAFLPASPEQVARLSMQRRVFTVAGKPFVATRDGGGFHETHATLARLIEPAAPGGPATAGGGRGETVRGGRGGAVPPSAARGDRRSGLRHRAAHVPPLRAVAPPTQQRACRGASPRE